MNRYMAKIRIDYAFAREKLSEKGSFWKDLLPALPSECLATVYRDRFTFGTYFLQAENKNACRELLLAAWKQVFGNDAAAQINIVEYDEEKDVSKLMSSIFNNYYGFDNYISLTEELADQIPLLRNNDGLEMMRGQSFLAAVDGGCGCTTVINSFGDYLHRMFVYPEDQFESRKYYIEMKLGKETEGRYTSADDVIDVLKTDSDKNSYNIIGLDISYFLDGNKHDELRDFLNRLDDYQDKYIFLFRVPFMEKKALDEITAVLSDQLLLRVIQMPPLDDTVLLEAIWDKLSGKGYYLDSDTFDLISRKIHQEKMDGRFYGFKTALKIAQEILLKKAAVMAECKNRGEEFDKQNITAADLDGLLESESTKLTGFEALNELIGMEDISKRVKEIVAQVKVAIANEKLDRPCIHMRFTGSPGTGKTTVARIIGQILREEGVLRKGGFFEYEARELVAEYEGQTAVKTASICRDAYGSVLFIDEAYALNEGSGGRNVDFGREALATLISEMENHRDDMLVVMAGYEDDMNELMKVNQGLRSRMPYILHFPNYTKKQLFDIFMLMVKKHFQFDPELEKQAHDYFMSLSDEYIESKEFANARFSRNLYERTWSKGALRASLAGKTNIIITKEDFVAASSEKEFNERIDSKKKVGFAK